MLNKQGMTQHFRWIFLVVLACFCFGGNGVQGGEIPKRLHAWATEQSQSNREERPFCPFLNAKQKPLSQLYAFRSLSLKEDTGLLKSKKNLAKVILFSLWSDVGFIGDPPKYHHPIFSYQFSRLNVLSSQHHPPTFA